MSDKCLDEVEPQIQNLSYYYSSPTVYTTEDILEQISDWEGMEKVVLLEADYKGAFSSQLSFALQCHYQGATIEDVRFEDESVACSADGVYVLEGLQPETDYTLTADVRIGNALYSLPLTVNLSDAPVGIDGVQAEEDDLSLRGSLSDGTAMLSVPGKGGEVRWALTSSNGAVMAQGQLTADGSWQRLDVAGLPKGLYLLEVRGTGKAKVLKVLAM